MVFVQMLSSFYIGEQQYNHGQRYEIDGKLADELVKARMAEILRDSRV
jgi:hypothetical protein